MIPVCVTSRDALGVWYENDAELVQELLQLVWLKGDEQVEVRGETLPLAEALQKHFELTVNTPQIVEQYAALSRNEALLALAGDKPKLQSFAQSFRLSTWCAAPTELNAGQLTGLLRPLTPRLYSIASSQAESETEVHITVGAVRN